MTTLDLFSAYDTNNQPHIMSKALPVKREEIIGDCRLLLGDSQKILSSHLTKFDAIITDPPYSATTHAGARSLGRDDGNSAFIDFAAISEEEILYSVKQWLKLARRWIVFTCDWRYAAILENTFPDEFIRLGIWVKPNGAPQFTGDRPGTG